MAEISAWDKFWIGFIGADLNLARQNPTDIPALRTFGYQLAALWLLFFTIQGTALTVITRSIEIGCLFSALSSTILILAERIFVSGDWYNEGHYWTIHEIDPSNPELIKINRRRVIYVLSRLGIGIAISISVVSLAEPGLFPYEQAIYAKREAAQKYPEELNQYRGCKSMVINHIQDLTDNEKASCVGTPLQEQSSSRVRLADVQRSIDTLAAQEFEFRRNYIRECAGERFATGDDKIAATGKQGCQTVANSWKQQADAVEDRIRPLRAEKSRLENQTASQDPQLGQIAQRRLSQCPQARAELRQELRLKDTKLHVCDLQYQGTHADPKSQEGGLMRTIEYHIRMKNDAKKELRAQGANPDDLWWYLVWLKVFIVFLESALFLSKVLGRVRGYAKAVYRAQAGSGVNAPV